MFIARVWTCNRHSVYTGEWTHFGERRHPEEFASHWTAGLRGMWNVPPRNNDFVGRAAELRRIRSSLDASTDQAPPWLFLSAWPDGMTAARGIGVPVLKVTAVNGTRHMSARVSVRMSAGRDHDDRDGSASVEPARRRQPELRATRYYHPHGYITGMARRGMSTALRMTRLRRHN